MSPQPQRRQERQSLVPGEHELGGWGEPGGWGVVPFGDHCGDNVGVEAPAGGEIGYFGGCNDVSRLSTGAR